MSLKVKVLSGVFWTFLEQIGVKGVSFLVQIILARILMPKDFGLIALVTVFIGIGNALADSGMNQSLIRTKNPSQRDFSTVFYLNIIAAIFVYALIFIVAPSIANFYNQKELTLILRVISLMIPINSCYSVQSTILTIKMDFKLQMFIQVPAILLSGICAIFLALNGHGVWALVSLQLLTAIIVAIQYWFYSDWRPKIVFDKVRLKYHFNFGYKLMLTTIINSVFNDIYNIIIGKYFSTSKLGFYNRASVFQKFPSILSGRVINRVTYPLFSKLTDDVPRLKEVFKKINKLVMFVYAPIILILIANAEEIMVILLTEKWIGIVPIFQILCIGGIIQPLQYYNTNIIKSFGKTALILKINLLSRVFTVIGIFMVIPYGILPLVVLESVNMYIIVFLFMHYGGKFISYPLVTQLKDILPEFCLSILVTLICYFAVKPFVNNIISIGVFCILFLLLYLSLSYFFKLSSLNIAKVECKLFLNKIKKTLN